MLINRTLRLRDAVEVRERCHVSVKDANYARIQVHSFQDKAKAPAHSPTSEFN